MSGINALSCTLLNIPKDVLSVIVNKIDSDTILKTFTVCKKWLELTLELTKKEPFWEERALTRMPFVLKNPLISWKKHCLLNIYGSRPRKIEPMYGHYISAHGTLLVAIQELKHYSKTGYWNTETGHKGSINALELRGEVNDTFKILAGSSDKTITVWYAGGSRPYFYKVSTCVGHNSPVTALKWLGLNFISGGADGRLHYWKRIKDPYWDSCGGDRYKLQTTHKAHAASITYFQSINILNQEQKHYIFSGAVDGSIGVSIIRDGKITTADNCIGHDSPISSMLVFKCRKKYYLYTATSKESAIKIWKLNMKESKLEREGMIPEAHEGGVNELRRPYPDAEMSTFMSCGKDRTVKIWSKLTSATAGWHCDKIISLSKEPLSFIKNRLGITYLDNENGINNRDDGLTTNVVIFPQLALE